MYNGPFSRSREDAKFDAGKHMKNLIPLAICLFIGVPFLCSETTKFEGVKIRRHESTEKRQLVDKVGVLIFDDDARRLTFGDKAGDQFAVPYSDVTKVVFDTDTHGTGLPPSFVHAIIRQFPVLGLRLRAVQPAERSRPQPPSAM